MPSRGQKIVSPSSLEVSGRGKKQRNSSGKWATVRFDLVDAIPEETTMTLTRIAQRLNLNVAGSFTNLLRHAKSKQRCVVMRDCPVFVFRELINGGRSRVRLLGTDPKRENEPFLTLPILPLGFLWSPNLTPQAV
jgi:hypothetical protein